MTIALRLAEQGLYSTQPNPRVGCVIVKNQRVIGEGAHLKAGDAHAEVIALRQAGADALGADVYVTLEPCNHYGRTPPCVDALIAAGVRRVVMAMEDPNPLVSGRGKLRLQTHGIDVASGLMQQQAFALNAGFIKRMTQALPYVRCKVAASLDGRTALNNGESQWITGEAARLDVQSWRAQSCAILTGIGTVLSDNPRMTVRVDGVKRQPLRVIVDSRLNTPIDCNMLKTAQQAPVMIAYSIDSNRKLAHFHTTGVECLHLPNAFGQVDLKSLLQHLAQRGINEVLVEAGQGLNGAMLEADLIDEFIFYYAPKLMGGDAKPMFAFPELKDMGQIKDLKILDLRRIGQDIRLRAKPLHTRE